MKNAKDEVPVIGLGAMGTALARALLCDGHHVTVWNRTSAKAGPLVREGAVLAPSVASAVAAGYENEEVAALIKVLRGDVSNSRSQIESRGQAWIS
jgi:glutamyl-tRNA reductase